MLRSQSSKIFDNNSQFSNMKYDNQNIFAKILREEIPCIKVYENNLVLAFMDIMPEAKGHVLIIPKEKSIDLFSLSNLSAISVLQTTKKVAFAQKKALNADGIIIKQMNGESSGQTIFHYHMHVIPTYRDQSLTKHFFQEIEKNVLEDLAKKIRCEIKN